MGKRGEVRGEGRAWFLSPIDPWKMIACTAVPSPPPPLSPHDNNNNDNDNNGFSNSCGL